MRRVWTAARVGGQKAPEDLSTRDRPRLLALCPTTRGGRAWHRRDVHASCRSRRTTISGCTSRRCRPRRRAAADHRRAARARTCSTERPALPRLPGRPVHRPDRLLARRGARPGDARAGASELPYYTNWTYAHPPAIELAAKLAELDARRHQPLLLRLGRLGGRRVGDQAGPRVPRRRGQPMRRKVIARKIAYHGTTLRRALADRHHRPCARRSSR